MIANPYETTSDSFYFVGEELVMHNKAAYKYTESGAVAPGKPAAGGAGDKASAKQSKEDKSYKGAKSSTAEEDAKWSKETDYYD